MIHRGEIVENAVRQSGMAISEVAKRMNKSRRHIYNLFESPNVPIETILQISKIIHYDISKDIPELYNLTKSQTVNETESQYLNEKSVEFWKDKYLTLLEKYNKLLEDKSDRENK